MISIIVAHARNRVIGREGDLPWRLSADLRRFKQLTLGHHLIMGRKTLDSIGRLLPGRTTIVLTRDPARVALPGALAATSLDEALQLAAGDAEIFVIGGGEVYRAALPRADRLYLTLVHAEIEGDTFFPEIHPDEWQLIERSDHQADEKNHYDYSFLTFQRKSAQTP